MQSDLGTVTSWAKTRREGEDSRSSSREDFMLKVWSEILTAPSLCKLHFYGQIWIIKSVIRCNVCSMELCSFMHLIIENNDFMRDEACKLE